LGFGVEVVRGAVGLVAVGRVVVLVAVGLLVATDGDIDGVCDGPCVGV
jgi:hypothetical protein